MNSHVDAWEQHRERLLRFVISRGVQPDDAEDIVQDVLAKALAPGRGPSSESKLVPWLYQVVRNAIADHWRRSKPTEEVPEDLAMAESPVSPPSELLACIEPFLSRLEEEDARVLRLADEEEQPQAAIAERLGLSVSGAKSRIQRARAKVFEMYRECCAVELDRKGRYVSHESNCGPSGKCGSGSSGSCGERG